MERTVFVCKSYLLRTLIVVVLSAISSLGQGQQDVITLNFYENVEPPALVGNMAINTGRPGDAIIVLTENEHLMYGDLSTSLSDLFDFQPNGDVYAKRKLDREVLATFNFPVLQQSKIYSVNINILDVNDNAPTFRTLMKNITVGENKQPNDQLSLLGSAIDPDNGSNSTQRYAIVRGNDNSEFKLDLTQVGTDDRSVVLKLNKFLDYEQQRSYSLVVRAYDGFNLTGDMTVNVFVADVNDVDPEFEMSRYSAQILENATIGQLVLTVHADDEETGANGVVEYELSAQDTLPNYDHFAVDATTGAITVRHALNFVTQKQYRLSVLAKNPSAPQKFTVAVVEITVLNVNDEPPTVSVDQLISTVAEDLGEGTPVLRLSLDDPDGTDATQFRVELSGAQGAFVVEKRDRQTFLVKLGGPLDRETIPVYNLSVTAWDDGTPPVSTTEHVLLHIADINDNTPTFNESQYTLQVDELVAVGSPVGNITATDEDIGDNGLITYTMESVPGRNSDWFSVHNSTGLVLTDKEPITCVTGTRPQFYIRATDNGPSTLTSRVLVNVNVRDVNDNEPVFDESFYNERIPENSDIGRSVITVTAKDSDCGVNSEVSYSLTADGVTAPDGFSIDASSGVITVTGPLDYEANKQHEFPVMAVDRGGKMSSVNVKVTITDVNDNKPVFYPTSYAANVRSSDAPGSNALIVVKATDADSSMYGPVVYSLAPGDANQYFQVDQNSGAIRLSKSLPVDGGDTYTLYVRAQDGEGQLSAVPASVTVVVVGGTEQIPIFTKSLYTFSVIENSENGQSVGTVQASIQGDSSSLTYSIVSGDPEGYFSINHQTGAITTSQVRTDREEHSYVLLNVRADNSGVFGNSQVNVTIGDENDNRPEFTSVVSTLYVPEDQDTIAVLYSVQAIDQDIGDKGRVKYQLTHNPDNKFQIDPITGALQLKSSLDYETRSNYSITVRAFDLGTSSQTNDLTITIQVKDINDHSPSFTQNKYNLAVSELIEELTPFGSVSANDQDGGNNAKITYTIQETQEEFGIYPSTGRLYNKVSFRGLEKREPYTFHVIATDGGSTPRSATCTVEIVITDENDNTPRFNDSLFSFSVKEDTKPNTQIGQVTATDEDAGVNARIAYTVAESVTSFRMDRNTGKLYINGPLDHETTPFYEFTVTATDGGVRPRTNTSTIRINIQDVNDNAPAFQGIENAVIPAYVYENKPEVTPIIQVTAVDPDKDENGRVTYYLTGDLTDKFIIDPITGWIRSQVTFDREARSVYNVTAQAKDNGNPQQVTEAIVMIHVQDMNEPPRFTSSYLKLTTEENIRPGTVVGRVQALDEDQDANSPVHYTVTQYNPDNPFDVNITSGTVFSVLPVDYEKISSHWLLVSALDSEYSGTQGTTINVTIDIIDVNDNKPQFTEDPTHITIVENTQVGPVIGRVTAHDADSGLNGEVVYEIASEYPEDAKDMFTINPDTGDIRTANEINFEELPGVLLVVKATDKAENVSTRSHSTMTVSIVIQDINDNSPVFHSRDSVSVAEDEPVGYPILPIIATDDDTNNSISYSIIAGDPQRVFSLDSTTGVLRLNNVLDRETTAVYNLRVNATDTGNPPNHATQVITVNVIDVNDNNPRFLNRSYTANVSESKPSNTEVKQVIAVDPDEGRNAELVYLIPGGLADDMFSVDSTGMIRTTEQLDRETKSSYSFSAYVKDSAFPALYDWCTVTVHVDDENDHAPYFLSDSYYQTVPENLKDRNNSIFQVLARDDDIGTNAQISYSIATGNDGNKFSINAVDGRIFANSLNREDQERYTLTIQATDHGVPTQQSTTKLTVTVSDRNDNDPQFTNGGIAYKASLNETVVPGTYVLTVAATDADRGNNSKISYFISNNGTEGKFVINMDTGVISTSLAAGHFDREKQSSYTFEVTAQDNAEYDPRSKRTFVEVTITDVNDNAPQFREVPFKVNITQLHNIEFPVVTTIVADDEDIGINQEIEYSIVGDDTYFRVDSQTGDIKVKASLVDVDGVHRLKVRATDKGAPPLYSDGWVEINVGSSVGPQTFKFDNNTYTVYLDEDAEQNDLVMKLTASHSSGSNTNSVSYSLSGDVRENNPFKIDPISGEIRVQYPGKLDYEVMRRYRVVAVAMSGTLTDYCTVWVNVRDKNDNSPVFTQDRYHGRVGELDDITTYIYLVQATDADSGINGDIKYSLQGENAKYLHIGERTGIVTLAERIDRENTRQIRVTVVAQDKGNPHRTGESILRVTVLDDNDNVPTFTNLVTEPVNVNEDMEIGNEVFIVSALDRDSTPEVTFDFTTNGNPDNTFNIDHLTGRITLAKTLDHENVDKYTVRLVVNDTLHASYGNLYVNVTDENDNMPVFHQASYEITIPENYQSFSTPILRVQAEDKDSGDNGRVTYSLQGAGVNQFRINSSTGDIFIKSSIQYSNEPTVNLAVKAADGGTPELSALAFAQIHIEDINDSPPVFSSPNGYSETISEVISPGSETSYVLATDDDDSPDNKRITFSIVGGNNDGVFGMENRETNKGTIVLMKHLDRETKDRYELIVMAKDGAQRNPKNTTTSVVYTISDFNDWPPVFRNTVDNSTNPVIMAFASENVTAGFPIVKVEATDKDINDNAAIDYIFTSGNDDGLFQINQTSGLIKLAEGKTLDYDTKQEHRMQIRASDNGVPRKSALATVILKVADVNDNHPVFRTLMYLETVEESKPSGTFVFEAKAYDQDAGIYGNLTYSLHGEQSSKFSIDRRGGIVTTTVAFNYEGVQTYKFRVNATDLGGLSASVQVSVNVLSADDFTPEFESHNGYPFSVDAETIKVGDEVGQVRAADKDQGDDGVIQYTLMGENPYFVVATVFDTDSTYGSIRVSKPLIDDEKSKAKSSLRRRRKRDADPKTTLQIKAWSGKPNSRYSTTNVTISISGVAAPVSIPASATTPTGSTLTTVEMIIIIVVISAVVLILIVVIIVIKMRTCRNVKRDANSLTAPRRLGGDQMDNIHAGEYGVPRGRAPPPYGHAQFPPYTGSQDYTDRSQCASSGRGSAEFDDGDEEIRTINTVPLHVQQRSKMMPDSGIQRDTDTVSEHSAKDHQEYLARLGIDPKKIGGEKKELGQSVESMHQFSDEGGGEADPLDISNLYSKLTDDGEPGETSLKQMGFGEAPAQIGSLSSVTDASEEFTGSYNWDYLLDWGPQYQPLADVFAEIARLKDETIQPKRKPVQTIPQVGQAMNRPGMNSAFKVGGPPPIITGAPPRVDQQQQQQQQRQQQLSNLSSARTSQLTSMVSLPHSPISCESSFSNLAFSPSFTPALSPLGTRSPSVSTLQSGTSTPNRIGSRPMKNMNKPASVTESDMFRI